MESKDKDMFQSVLEIMRKRMKENIKKMEHNNNESSNILKTEEPSTLRSKTVNSYAVMNNELTKENNELLRIHSQIIKYLNEYGIASNVSQVSENYEDEEIKIQALTVEEVFEMTVKGEISIDENYPLLSDEKFMNNLMEYYTENEAYEQCAKIKALVS